MYLSRTNSLLDIFIFLLMSLVWSVGGWLLVTHAFRLCRVERLISSLAVGFLLFISLSNFLAHFLPLTLAFWGASGLILMAGVACAWRSHLQPWLEKRDLLAFPMLFILAAITLLFTLILKGEAIFDEYLHIPLISTMASGDIPPHFYLNGAYYFAYHYGIQVFAASLVRMADLFPWSAWDISRALAIAFTFVLGWLWVHRVTRSTIAAWSGTILFVFGGGTRWLLLLLPAPWLNWISRSVSLAENGLDTAPTLALALHRPWMIEGSGPVLFPFAFHNGIFVPVFFNLGSSGAMPYLTILALLLLIPPRRFSIPAVVLWSILFSTLALSAEHLFAFIWIGIALAMGISFVFQKRHYGHIAKDSYLPWGVILALSGLIALIQGGFFTEVARNLIAGLTGFASQSTNARGFSFRWPPGLLSAQLGFLSVLNVGQRLTLLMELGPAIILVLIIFTHFKKWLQRKDWFTAGLAISAALGLIFPLFLRYEVDRSTTRMPSTALWTGLVLGFPIIWVAMNRAKTTLRLMTVAGYAIVILAGLIIFRTQLYSIPDTEYTYFIDGLDARYSATYWNKLPVSAQVLDRVPSRSVSLFGRATRASSDIYAPLPDWEALIKNPIPAQIADAGYDYVYMDRQWWDSLTASQQSSFLQPCIDVMDEREQERDGVLNYRLLIDMSGCK